VSYYGSGGDEGELNANPSSDSGPFFQAGAVRPTDLFPETLTGRWMALVAEALIAQSCEKAHVASYVDVSE